MSHPMNDASANIELSIDQLDAVAGGGWFSSATHWVAHEVHVVGHAIGEVLASKEVAAVAGTIVLGGALILGGGTMKLN